MTPQRVERRLFIGSSVEGLRVAKALRLNFEHETAFHAFVWDTVDFRLSAATLDSLRQFLNDFSYAVFVLTPDDGARIREKPVRIPRDNVLFELGLFLGRAGPSRTFAIKPRGVDIHLPTDLAGITLAEYTQPHHESELGNALLGAAEKIRVAILTHERDLRETANRKIETWKAETRAALRQCKSDTDRVSVVCSRLHEVIEDKAAATSQTVEGVLQDLLLDVESLMDVLDPQQLSDYQRGPALKEVWIQSQEPLEVLEPNTQIRNRVCDNLARGIKYTYIVPSAAVKNRIKKCLLDGSRPNGCQTGHILRIIVAPDAVFHAPYTVQKYADKSVKVLQSLLRPGRKDILHELDHDNALRIERKLSKIISCAGRVTKEDAITYFVGRCPICDAKIRAERHKK